MRSLALPTQNGCSTGPARSYPFSDLRYVYAGKRHPGALAYVYASSE